MPDGSFGAHQALTRLRRIMTQSPTLNWHEARKIAKRWLDLHHPGSIEAKHIDLRGKDGDLIIADPAFRAEIFSAVVRILKARRAASWKLPQ
jgi:hypothetical protein